MNKTKIHSGYLEIVELVLKNGADINAKNKDNNTALHAAAQNGNVRIENHQTDQHFLTDQYLFIQVIKEYVNC